MMIIGSSARTAPARADMVASSTAPPAARRSSQPIEPSGRSSPSTTSRRSFGQSTLHLPHDGGVVDRSRPVDDDQGGRVGLVDGVLRVLGPVAGVQRDGDGADGGDGVHEEQPLRAVRHPDADLVAGLDADADQAAGHPVDLGGELGVGPAPVAEDQGLTVAPATGRLAREVAHAPRPIRLHAQGCRTGPPRHHTGWVRPRPGGRVEGVGGGDDGQEGAAWNWG